MQLLTVRQVAEKLQVTPSRIYELARIGLIPTVRLGRQVRISKHALEDWIASGGQALAGGWKRSKDLAGK